MPKALSALFGAAFTVCTCWPSWLAQLAGALAIGGALWFERKGCLRPADRLPGLPRFRKVLFALAPEISPDPPTSPLGGSALTLGELLQRGLLIDAGQRAHSARGRA